MATLFRTTATLSDSTGKYRTEIILASRLYVWSEESKKEVCERSNLPKSAIEVSNEEYDSFEANPSLRCGYVEKAGDTTTPFNPEAWK